MFKNRLWEDNASSSSSSSQALVPIDGLLNNKIFVNALEKISNEDLFFGYFIQQDFFHPALIEPALDHYGRQSLLNGGFILNEEHQRLADAYRAFDSSMRAKYFPNYTIKSIGNKHYLITDKSSSLKMVDE